MNTILVTGGAGFVGSHACKALARAGYLPVTFDNFERGHQSGALSSVAISEMKTTYAVLLRHGVHGQSRTSRHMLMLESRSSSR